MIDLSFDSFQAAALLRALATAYNAKATNPADRPLLIQIAELVTNLDRSATTDILKAGGHSHE